MIPATPISGTADTNPLLDIGDYQAITGDTTTFAGVQAELTPVLADAVDIFCRQARRTVLYANYTERLFLYRNGMVYPSATPLDTSKGVVSPNGSPPENVGIFQGNGIWVGWYVPLPSLPVWSGVVPPQTDITYWGGYTGPEGGGPYLPASLKRILAKLCWYITHPVTLPGLPAGVKSMSIGGVSISGTDFSAITAVDPQLARDIRRWRHPHAKGFDAQPTT